VTLVTDNYNDGRLSFTTNLEDGVSFGEFQFIAVGTPPDEDGFAICIKCCDFNC